jgi:hypothetical protein
MSTGYCYFCDQPAADDPCPTCGKTLHRPAKTRTSRPEVHREALVSPDEPPSGAPMAAWVKWVVTAIVLIVIGVILRSPFGI